eukprot:3602169-Pyramimonas_sp.AAC.2
MHRTILRACWRQCSLNATFGSANVKHHSPSLMLRVLATPHYRATLAPSKVGQYVGWKNNKSTLTPIIRRTIRIIQRIIRLYQALYNALYVAYCTTYYVTGHRVRNGEGSLRC